MADGVLREDQTGMRAAQAWRGLRGLLEAQPPSSEPCSPAQAWPADLAAVHTGVSEGQTLVHVCVRRAPFQKKKKKCLGHTWHLQGPRHLRSWFTHPRNTAWRQPGAEVPCGRLVTGAEREARGGTWPRVLLSALITGKYVIFAHQPASPALHLVNTARSLLSFSICKEGLSLSSGFPPLIRQCRSLLLSGRKIAAITGTTKQTHNACLCGRQSAELSATQSDSNPSATTS